MKIIGTVNCKDCKFEEENPEMIMSCPSCGKFRMKHTPPKKIYLCDNQNPEGHGRSSGKLSNIHKKIRDDMNGKEKTYKQVLKLIKSNRKEWTTKEILNYFNISGMTDGDVIRTILDLLVCQGHLEKKFMKGNKYHLYNSDVEYVPCKFLADINSGKRKGIYRCRFDFKKEGKELDSYKIFKVKDNG